MAKRAVEGQRHTDDPYEWVTPDYRLRHIRDLQGMTGDPRRATSGNAYSWATKGLIVKNLIPDAGLVLDVGCGWGRNLALLPNAIGIDMSYPFLMTARNYVSNPLILGNACQLPFADSAFDAIVITEVIEHIPNAHLAISEASRVLKQGGRLVLSTPNKTITQLTRIPGHVREFRYGELHEILVGEGFEVLIRVGSTIPYIPRYSRFEWLDSNPFFFWDWKLLDRLFGRTPFLKWDQIILAQLKRGGQRMPKQV